MLTPVEMQGRELKAGRGYQKKDVEAFLSEVYRDFETMYRENMELKDRVNTLSEGLKYYKDLEKTLQKTLVVAEKTAEETTKVAQKKASVIISEAKIKANQVVQEANTYFEKTRSNIKALMQEYESYRIQCQKLAAANLDLLNSDAFKVNFESVELSMPEFVLSIKEDIKPIKKEELVTEPIITELTTKETATKEKPPEKDNEVIVKESSKPKKEKELDTELFEFFNLNDE